jgi:CcmD family protein
MNMVALAYGFIWLAVLVYVVLVARRLARLNSEMSELQRRIDRMKDGAA